MNYLSLFNGMGCGDLAFKSLGIKTNKYYASEVDKYSNAVAKYNNPNMIELGDVRDIDVKRDIKDRIDILIGGSPCTNFSFAGKQNGMSTKCNMEILSLEHYLQLKEERFEFDGQSYLFWEFMRLLKDTKPKYFLLENVKMAKKWKKILSDAIGIEPILINSALMTAQNRNRLYWCGKLVNGKYVKCDISQPKDKGILLKDIIESGFSTEEMTNKGKSHCVTKSYNGAVSYNSIERKQRTMVCSNDTVIVDKAATIKKSYYKSSKANFNADGGPHHATGVVINSHNIINLEKGSTDKSWFFEQQCYDINSPKTRTLKAGGGSGNIPKVFNSDKKVITNINPSGRGQNGNVYNVDSDKSHCIMTNKGEGFKIGKCIPVDKESNGICKQVAIASDINGHDILKRIYSEDGKSPCLTGGKGGNLEPKMVIKDGGKEQKVCCMNEVRSEEGKRIRKEKVKGGKDFTPFRAKQLEERVDGKVNCLTTSVGKNQTIKLEKEQLIYRKLTPLECERLQGVSDNTTAIGMMPDKKGVVKETKISNSRRYMMLGNGWTVSVIAHLFKEMGLCKKQLPYTMEAVKKSMLFLKKINRLDILKTFRINKSIEYIIDETNNILERKRLEKDYKIIDETY